MNWYVYCSNNPIAFIDWSGKYHVPSSYPINRGHSGYGQPVAQVKSVNVAQLISGFYNERLMKSTYGPQRMAWDRYAPNQKNNSTVWQNAQITGPIYNQNEQAIADMKMGAAYAGSSGCGWIAAYNTTYLMGNTQNPADIIYHVESNGGLIANGHWGSNPEAYADYFNDMGMNASITYDLSAGIDSQVQNGDVFMLLYSHEGGAHYISVEYNNGQYQAYNVYKDSSKVVGFTSMDTWLKDNNYIANAFIGF